QTQVHRRAYPFHRINRTTFQRGVHFTRSYVGGAGANSGKDFTGKARNTDFQAFQIIEAVDFFAEPTTHLHTGVTAGYRDQVVGLVHFLHQLHAAAVVEPAVLFGGGHTKRTGEIGRASSRER